MKKILILGICICILSVGCETFETFDVNGKRTSRTSKPSAETWTTISNAVASAGVAAVKSWADQIAQQQKWERGEK